jgi:polyhydroxyalkanoate synthesis regulator phasin
MILAHLIQSASSLPTDASALESSISALERQITALESSSIPLERLLPWFTGLVALGVAMEFWVIWREYCNERKAWALGTICAPEKPSLTQFAVATLSVLLITGGIVGELWVGIKITSFNGVLRSKNAELRSDSDQLLALVTQQAGGAAQSAKTAHDEASMARQEADSFEQDIVSAKKQAADAESHLANALQQAADAEREVIRLRGVMADRILTPAQQATIASRLVKYGPRTIDVLIVGSTGEITRITDMILAALAQARWTVGNRGNALGATASGIFVGTVEGADPDTEEAANVLIGTLKMLGLAADRLASYPDKQLPTALTGNWNTNATAPIRIIIASKP